MKRVLVIDDDYQIRALLRQMLVNQGYEVDEAHDGKAAMSLQRRKAADLVITDLIMPQGEGIETIRALRKEFPQVKIIAVTGGGLIPPETYLPFANAAGADRTFMKPFEPDDFLRAVDELTGNLT